ncbi:uncharacterized protein SAPINGB_P005432 [Magnusiomyces paraingens]|uniref:Carboxylesterase type B domain-containing protein n=1 Tax=Magnusiomyces paraingens TaxID=2606893 RepID=A0A5E8C226_9ASCO|nr:uncharacterized protein SAPINGB_P005432 [Saprochaete ingens]VVT56945.1 unnamed protein product [Saprochaete ingens]
MKFSAFIYLASFCCISAKSYGTEVQLIRSDGDVITGLEKNGVESYRGIPFANAPLGNLRFRPSIPYNGSLDGFRATDYGPSCYNQNFVKNQQSLKYILPLIRNITPSLLDFAKSTDQSEDCLNLNVYRPAGVPSNAKLPVMVWVYGGAFQTGSSAMYPGEKWIQHSVKLGEPVIFVTINYRLGPFGFLGGNAIADEGSGNPAIWDVVNGFKWVQDNIADFGGNPDRITALGESSGAMMITHTMLSSIWKRKPLFNAAVLQSGSLLPFGPVDAPKATELFWFFANGAGCGTTSSGQKATEEEALKCLRFSNTKTLWDAQSYNMNPGEVYDIANEFIVWGPRQDGYILEKNPLLLAEEGRLPDIPIIIGNQEDEGTLISLITATRSNEEFESLMRKWFPSGGECLETALKMYPMDKAEGAPFRTGNANELYPGFKRSSAFLTDLLYVSTRRQFLSATEKNRSPRYTYFSDSLHNKVPFLGTFHTNCIIFEFFLDKFYPSNAYRGYFISFANHFDPNTNNGGLIQFPQYHESTQDAVKISFKNGSLMKDDYRRDRTNYILSHKEFFETY